jgi:hypothetical protein
MRSEIIDYLNNNRVAGFTPTTELPWDSNGTPLYVKNFKRIYVDQTQVDQEPLIDVLNGPGIVNEVSTVRIYVTTDAKTAPSNLDQLISVIKNARLDLGIEGVTQRATQVSTELTSDYQVTQFDISTRKLIVNH